VIEAMKIGMGTTGNSTGNLYVTVDEHLSHIKKKWNAGVARQVVESRSSAIDFIEQMVNKYSISCGFQRVTFNHFAESDGAHENKFIEDEFNAFTEAGLKPLILDNHGLPFGVKKCLSLAGQAQFHPLDYVTGLANNLPAGCTIYENTRIMDYDEAAGTVKTESFTVKANKIIMATHVPKGFFMVQTVLGPYREFGVAAKLRSGSMPPGIFWGLEQPKHSIRSYSYKGDNYVMVIGDKFKTGQHGNSGEYIQELKNYLSQRFDIAEFTCSWGGQQYRPADGLPYIGSNSEKMYYLTGFSTDGLVYGTLGAMIISDEILGKENKYAEVFKASRHTPVKSAPKFIKENFDNVGEMIKDYLHIEKKDLEAIAPGEGKVINIGTDKIAVCRTANGSLEAVSAICTHMYCVVHWNGSEKSWDCPCHGSRFKTNGDVIEGPALWPLGKKNLKAD
jgi:glycine/D-amino acid oxidase-like deaminating enzyme/nitrite reductase/ring-hydroxylating ferredoxin subunit